MTFEEFFKKKRIDLVALQSSEPALFSEFESHFKKMGEKSFDHTKKYWFNKLRLQYHLAPELKPEKVHIENPLAKQTITEALIEEKMPAPSVGFKPRFKPGMADTEQKAESKKPVEEGAESETPVEEEAENEKLKAESPVDVAPKPTGFKPRFNAKMVAPKTEEAESENPVGEKAESEKLKAESSVETAPKPAGFKPRFNAKMVAPKTEEAESEKPVGERAESEKPVGEKAESEKLKAESPVETAPKPAGFKPRFNAKMMKPKPPEE